MASRAGTRNSARSTRRPSRRRFRFPKPWPSASTRRRLWRAYRAAPATLQVLIAIGAIGLLWFLSNGVYQVVRKPTELFFPVEGPLYKTPAETWESYGTIFRRHSTNVITPEFLAALAQVEGSGNPVARTYWRWSWNTQPFEVYRPASSAVGMYQITDSTFAEARRYCIHGHVVVEDGPWHAWRSCWFNWLYMRVIPSDAAELTAAYLDRRVTDILRRHRIGAASHQHKQALAAMIHLCGAGAAEGFARRGFQLRRGQRCGDHSAHAYLARVEGMRREFARIAARDS